MRSKKSHFTTTSEFPTCFKHQIFTFPFECLNDQNKSIFWKFHEAYSIFEIYSFFQIFLCSISLLIRLCHSRFNHSFAANTSGREHQLPSFTSHSSSFVSNSLLIHHSFTLHPPFIHSSSTLHPPLIHHSSTTHPPFIDPSSITHSLFIHPSSIPTTLLERVPGIGGAVYGVCL